MSDRIDGVEEVRRSSDDELCGHVVERDGRWCALTVFGVVLGCHDRRQDAAEQVLRNGLASLAGRWVLAPGAGGEDEVVCILEADTTGVTLARGYYATPDVPTITISAKALAAGEWELRPLT